MSARLPGAVLALGLCAATAASAVRVGGEFPVAPQTPTDLLHLPAPAMREPQSALARTTARAQEMIDAGELLLASGLLEPAVARSPKDADLALTLAQVYSWLGRYDDALPLAEAVRAEAPKATAPNTVIGNAQMRRGDVGAAAAAFERWVKLAPNDAAAHERLGDALRRRDAREALAPYQTAIALEPGRVSALAKSAVLLVEVGRKEEGARRAERALAVRSDDSLALLALGYAHRAMGELDQAESAYRRGLARAPDHPPFTLRLAEVLREQGRIGPAIEALEALLGRVPEALAAREQLARLYGETGNAAHRELELGRVALAREKRDEAQRHFAAALAANPKLDDAALELALVEIEAGELAAASARVEKLSEAARASARADLVRGHLALARKDVASAQNAYQRAVEADSADPAATLALARLLARTDLCGEAVKRYADAIDRGARLPAVYSERAACHAELGELARAEESYRSALAQDPQHLDALYGLAQVYLSSETNPGLAGFLLERALALRPGDGQLHYTLGRARLAAGRPADAATEFEAALAKEPDRPEWLHELGATRLVLGERDEARRTLERVLEVAPAYGEAEAVRALLDEIDGGSDG